jgi:coenzyme Q-binding protein COQ10
VADVKAYPDFVKWVTGMRTWNRREERPGVHVEDAEASVGFSFLKERFSTWVRHDRNAPLVEVGLLRGPFRHLRNRWEFFPDPGGTRIEFMIDFAFRSPLLNGMLQANFDRAVSALMSSFEAEARRRYGPGA